jgi:hypothetical protein
MSQWAGESIHNAILSGLTSAPLGKKVTKIEFTYSGGNISTIKFSQDTELLFTLTFTWNGDGTLQSITRS